MDKDGPPGSVQFRVCLVTSGHLSTNPRLVKEADALAAAGYRVRVVATRFIAWADEADREFGDRPWTAQRIAFGALSAAGARIARAARIRLCRLVVRAAGPIPGLTERAFHWIAPELAGAARAIPADLYIAHTVAALPAAAAAARLHGARLGFDAEDFHRGELPDSPEYALVNRMIRAIEGEYLPQCDYVTASSVGIARAYAEACGIAEPAVVLNVFPRAEAPLLPPAARQRSGERSLYWFSQTIGAGRGLETAIEAIGLSRSRPILSLRGNLAPGYGEVVRGLASRHGVGDRLRLLPPAAPGEMARLAAQHDIGLAAEGVGEENRRLCASNKLFTYLLAGLPVIASDTPGQAHIASTVPDAMLVYPHGNARALAERIDQLLMPPEALAHAQDAAWKAGQDRYNWEVEKQTFLDAVATALARPSRHERQG